MLLDIYSPQNRRIYQGIFSRTMHFHTLSARRNSHIPVIIEQWIELPDRRLNVAEIAIVIFIASQKTLYARTLRARNAGEMKPI